MLIDIDPESEVPLYQQLRDRVVEAIAGGRLRPGEQLASVRQLASQFGINIATVGKGVELLRQEGLVRTTRRSGSIVSRGPDTSVPRADFAPGWTARLRTVLAEAVAQGMPETDIDRISADLLAEFRRQRNEGLSS
ncbi:MAG: GntR family transcriptional regulator [Actinomycetota bacterium]|nr:GntR family transcriptional regulator [Actinomycetota bacterium]